ncbi:MAG: hypothetical protein IKS85_06230 [Lachnospiraceae bacterium]|nr:hypothetical protein [Lachnospiraceae bacterium]
MGIDWTNLTFNSLGFEGIRNLSSMRFNIAKGRYETLEFSGTKSVAKEFLVPMVVRYLTAAQPKGFVAALAYMQDGSIEYAKRITGRGFAVKTGCYDKDFYKTCNYIDATSNIQCVDSLIMTHRPEGLMLFQEIPCEDRKKRRFRIVHESFRDDKIDEKERKALLDIRKRTIVKSCTEYLKDLGGIEGLSEEELDGVVAILDVIRALDPNVKKLPIGQKKARRRKKDGEKILKFREGEEPK